MSRYPIRRRDFLKTVAAAAAVPLAGRPIPALTSGFDAKGLPTAVLGKTGVAVPRIGIGLGSRFCAVEDEDKALGILETALDQGFFYWDTAYSYTNKKIVSEECIGRVLARRRNEVFLATKFEERSYDGVMRQLDESLKRLRTDHL
ncbi:MAG: aldo/keto reductase, partial [Candidatus Aminicenantales bacterium]